jgi:hypothetical protein
MAPFFGRKMPAAAGPTLQLVWPWIPREEWRPSSERSLRPLRFGGTTLTAAGQEDVFIARYNANGPILWVKAAGGVALALRRPLL